jgi:hypothetical protein
MKAFDYGPDRVIAEDREDAKQRLRKELGEAKDKFLKRATPPFLLSDSDGEPFKVSEAEYCEQVQVYGDGMVYRA